MKFIDDVKEAWKILRGGVILALAIFLCMGVVVSQDNRKFSAPAPQVVKLKPDVTINKALQTVTYRNFNVYHVIEWQGQQLVSKNTAYFGGRGAIITTTRDASPEQVKLWHDYFGADT